MGGRRTSFIITGQRYGTVCLVLYLLNQPQPIMHPCWTKLTHLLFSGWHTSIGLQPGANWLDSISVHLYPIFFTMRLPPSIDLASILSVMSLVVSVLTQDIALKTFTPQGCFDSSDPLEDHGPNEFQSTGACQKQCVLLGKAVMGLTKGTNCWCGDYIPTADAKVSDSQCSSPCVGYDIKTCTWGTINRLRRWR